METLGAVLTNRFQVLARYGREVALPVLRQERARADASVRALLRQARAALLRDESLVNDEARARLQRALERSRELRVVWQFRERVQAVWARSAASQKERLEALQEWCSQAEATGIEALAAFASRLRGYALRPLRITSYNVCYTKLLRPLSRRPSRWVAMPRRVVSTSGSSGMVCVSGARELQEVGGAGSGQMVGESVVGAGEAQLPVVLLHDEADRLREIRQLNLGTGALGQLLRPGDGEAVGGGALQQVAVDVVDLGRCEVIHALCFRRRPGNVITSYSIHYTKLYDRSVF